MAGQIIWGPIMRNRISFVFLTLFSICAAALAFAQNPAPPQNDRRERTIDEIKTEAVRRAQVGQYPLIGLDPADVKEAFETIHTADKDEWAAGFMRVGDKYFNEAKSLEKIRSDQGERRLHPRLARLFFRTLALSRLSGQATRV